MRYSGPKYPWFKTMASEGMWNSFGGKKLDYLR